MNATFDSMDKDAALEISRWKYDTPYDFYNMDNGNEGIEELLNGTYFKICDDNHVVVGFCCFGNSAKVPIGLQHGAYPENGTIDVGLGMKPDLTGSGIGYSFVNAILEFAEFEFGTKLFRLTVAKFNQRAIHLYEKFGFSPVMVFPMKDVEFLTMERMLI